MTSFNENEIYSVDTQDEIVKAYNNLIDLNKEKANVSSPEINRLFGSFVNNIIILFVTMDVSQIGKKWCDDSLQLVTYWTSVSRFFVVMLPVIIENILIVKFNISQRHENQSDVKIKTKALDDILSNSESYASETICALRSIREDVEQRKRLSFIDIINKTVKITNIEEEGRGKYIDFFTGVYTPRSHYAHFSREVRSENEKEENRIKKGIGFVIKNNGKILLYPEDIIKIISQTFEFFDEISDKISKDN